MREEGSAKRVSGDSRRFGEPGVKEIRARALSQTWRKKVQW